jgi:F0F1-type ATP synthase assembly protein I
MSTNSKGKKKTYLKILSYSTIGIEMGISVGAGFFIGNYLDNKLQITKPYLTIFFIVAGFGAAVKSFIRMVKKLQKDFKDEN